MGTRSLICIFFKGRFVVAQYSQWDGYPEREGQGMRILQFLLGPSNIKRLKSGLECIKILRTKESEELQDSTNIEAAQPPPSLSRDTGAEILEIVAGASDTNYVPIVLDLEFANNRLFCEWAYVIDLDDEVFEVYRGLEGTVSKKEASTMRFNNVGRESDTVPTLVRGFSFQALPNTEKTFIEMLNEASGAGDGE